MVCDLRTSFYREDPRIVGVPVRYGWSDKTPAVMLASLASPQDPYQIRTAFYSGKKGNRNAQSNLLLSALEAIPQGTDGWVSMAPVQTSMEDVWPRPK